MKYQLPSKFTTHDRKKRLKGTLKLVGRLKHAPLSEIEDVRLSNVEDYGHTPPPHPQHLTESGAPSPAIPISVNNLAGAADLYEEMDDPQP